VNSLARLAAELLRRGRRIRIAILIDIVGAP
jgi:hypothetical protein